MNRLVRLFRTSIGSKLIVAASGTLLIGFLLFGSALVFTGGGEFFMNLAFALMGRSRGGPAKVAIVASGRVVASDFAHRNKDYGLASLVLLAQALQDADIALGGQLIGGVQGRLDHGAHGQQGDGGRRPQLLPGSDGQGPGLPLGIAAGGLEPAHPVGPLEHRHRVAGPVELLGAGQPGGAAADHYHVILLHEFFRSQASRRSKAAVCKDSLAANSYLMP